MTKQEGTKFHTTQTVEINALGKQRYDNQGHFRAVLVITIVDAPNPNEVYCMQSLLLSCLLLEKRAVGNSKTSAFAA